MCQNEMDTLTHYGVKGMKWGVRRYQNYDGSRTKRGVEHFKKLESQYDSAKAKGNSNEMKIAKRKMKNAYKQLKQDKRIDEGKKLHEQGYSEVSHPYLRAVGRQVVVNLGAGVLGSTLSSVGVDTKTVRNVQQIISTSASWANTYKWVSDAQRNKKLRAYKNSR